MRTAGNPTAWGKDNAFCVQAHDVRGKAVVDVEAGPAGAGGGTDDELGRGRGGADPAYVVWLGAGTDPGGCGG